MGLFQSCKNNEIGQTLVEMLVAIGLTAVMLPALLTSFVVSREGTAQENLRSEAFTLMKEMAEGVRSVRERDWNQLNNGTFYPSLSGTQWVLSAGSQTSNGFTKQVIISDVYRDSSGNIAPTGTLDPSTKRTNYTVSWTGGLTGAIQETEYLSRFTGNTAVTHTSQADFDLSGNVKTNTQSTSGGTIELIPAITSGSFVDDYTTPASYTYNTSLVEVVGGYAQLKNLTTMTNGTTTNQNFTTNTTGWTFTRFNTNVGQSGTRQATGGNTGGFAQINFPTSSGSVAGGFWRQSFTTTTPASTATLNFDYKVISYAATPDSFRIRAWIDTATGNPTNVVWDSGEINATTVWVTVSNVNVAAFIPSAGTYTLKVGAFVDYPTTNRGPYTVGFDNIDLDWVTGVPTYSSAAPTVAENTSFTASDITAWNSFAETSILNGGSIAYQLSDDDGATWKYWQNVGSGWQTATLNTHRNSATVVNQNISTFPATNKKIRVRAFLISNGSQFVRLDKVTIGYTGAGANSGTYISAPIDTGDISGFNRITWTESNTSNTTTRLRVATNSDNSTWTYVGPDGTSGTYFTGSSGTIPLNTVAGRYFRYEITFDSTTSDSANVSEVNINYSP